MHNKPTAIRAPDNIFTNKPFSLKYLRPKIIDQNIAIVLFNTVIIDVGAK